MGKFLGVGRDVINQGNLESQRLSEGKGSKRAKHRPNLENCQVVARNYGLCKNEEFGGSKGWEAFDRVF